MNPEKCLELTTRLNPEAVELARWVCLATRIDPALIRRARLRLMPGGNGGTESDLWFSPLVQTVGARYILFYPEVSNLLRHQLAGSRKDLARAWKVTRQTHRALPELMRLEEKLTWLSLKKDAKLERKLDALLRPLIKAILTGQREGLGRWALNVIPHLPKRARVSKSARLLRMIAESQLYGGWANLLTTIGDGPTDEEAALLLHGLDRTTVGLRLRGNNLEVSEPPEDGDRLIKVPATNPRVLELSWPHDGEQVSARLMWKKGEPGHTADVRLPLAVSTLAGDSHQITYGQKIIDFHGNLAAPYLVSILDASQKPVGLGVLVENDFVLTTSHSIRNANPDIPGGVEDQPVGFPLLRPEKIVLTRTAGSAISFQRTISQSELISTDYPMLLKLRKPASETRAAKLKSAFDLKGKVLLAPGIGPGGELDKWAAFEVDEATETGDFALIPVTQINPDNLSRWSGAPLVDRATRDVAGMLLVNKDDASVRLASLDQISRAFPEIFRAGSNVLITYSHRDSKHVEEFTIRMEEAGLRDRLVLWDDSRLKSETPSWHEMAQAMESATAVVLFVSPNYLASDFEVKDELPRLLRRAQERGAIILPVILSPSVFLSTPLARFQAVNDPRKPLNMLSSQERDEVFERLSEALSKQLGVTVAESSRSQPEFTTDFFISYHNADLAWAEWIAWQLEEAGYSTFLQSWDLEVGSNFVTEIDRAMKQSARTISVLTPDYLSSEFRGHEWAATLARDPTGEQRRLVPVRVRESELTGIWRSLVYIDLVGLSEQEASPRLVDEIKRVHPQPVRTDGPQQGSVEPVPFPVPVPAPTPESSPSRPIGPFSTDLFISFTKLDNEPFGDEKGWVDQFVKHLDLRLSQLLGRQLTIFIDTGLQGAEYFSGAIAKQLTETCIFVAIVTPGYVNSEWCREELKQFHRRAAETGGVTIGDRSRIFMVQKLPVERESLPVELRNFLGYQFYELDDRGRPQPIGTRSSRGRNQYLHKLEDLAQDIKTMLESVNAPAENAPLPPEVPAPPPDMTVYLAETTYDLADDRDRVRRELYEHGYQVLPDQSMPLTLPDYQNAVRECLVRSSLSVHLIGSNYGAIPEGEGDRSVVMLQEELAAERAAADPAFSCLLWMPPGLQPKESRQQAFVERLQTIFAPGLEVLQTPLEDLTTRIVEKLSRLRPDAQARGEEDDKRKTIYLICDTRDRPWVGPIQDHLLENNFEVNTSIDYEATEEALLDYHRKNLKECDAALIYYGSADEAWLRRNLEDLEKAYGYGREEDWSATAVYIGPPSTEEKQGFRTHFVPYIIRNFAEFDPHDLTDFISAIKLKQSNSTGADTR